MVSTGVLEHIRTRRKSPGQNGVRERAFGSLKYEHLHRHEITDGPTIAVEAAYLASTDMDQWRSWAIIGTVSAWVTSISHLLRTMPR